MTRRGTSWLVSLDVIIPTFGRADLLEELVAQLRTQTLQPASILFVDDTPDDSVLLAAKDLGVNYLRNDAPPSLTRARNKGIEATSQPYFCFLDSDIQLPPNYLERMVSLFAHPSKPVVVQAHVENPWRHQWWKAVPLWLLGQGISRGERMRFKLPVRQSFPSDPSPLSESEWLSGSNMVFHRERLGNIRFDPILERYCLGEDLEMGLQLSGAGKTMILDGTTTIQECNDAQGRIQNEDLERMRVINFRYILSKHFPHRKWNARLTFQDIGWLLLDPLRFPSAFRRYLRNRRDLRRNPTPTQWNKLYGFWK